MRQQLFAKKSLDVLLKEMAGEHRLRRVLGPVALSSLGIGAIIGTGIFVLTGIAARQQAGPGLILSFVLAGIACTFAALCYAEFASMAPVAGSAYTYAYVSLGELIAWIIGWDLVLEYAMASATVANGWAHYFSALTRTIDGRSLLAIPLWLSIDPSSAAVQHTDYLTAENLRVESVVAVPWQGGDPLELPTQDTERVRDVRVTFTAESLGRIRQMHGAKAEASVERIQSTMQRQLEYEAGLPPREKLDQIQQSKIDGWRAYDETPLVIGGFHLTCNAAALAIVALITAILVVGIRESAGFNAGMVLVKIAAVVFVIVVGVGYITPSNWSPFLPYGWWGVAGGASLVFFAYIGFDSVSTHAEEAINPSRDVPIGIIASLAVCTVLYIAVAAVITGMVPYPQIPLDAPIAGVFAQKGIKVASAIISIGAITGITSVLLVMLLSLPRVLLAMARDGLLPASFFGAVHPRFRTPHRATILGGLVCGLVASLFPLEDLSHMVNIGTLFAFVVVCAAVWLMRYIHPEVHRPFRTPLLWLVAPGGILLCGGLMYTLGWQNWVRLFVWLAIGLVIYFAYGQRHSTLGKELRGEISLYGVSPAGLPVPPEPEQK